MRGQIRHTHTHEMYFTESAAKRKLISVAFLWLYHLNLLQFEKAYTYCVKHCLEIYSQKLPMIYSSQRQEATAFPAIFQNDIKLCSCSPSLIVLPRSLQVCHHPINHCKEMKEVFHIPFFRLTGRQIQI